MSALSYYIHTPYQLPDDRQYAVGEFTCAEHCSSHVTLDSWRTALRTNTSIPLDIVMPLTDRVVCPVLSTTLYIYMYTYMYTHISVSLILKQYLWYGIKKIYFIGRNKWIIKKIECWPVFKQDPNIIRVLFDDNCVYHECFWLTRGPSTVWRIAALSDLLHITLSPQYRRCLKYCCLFWVAFISLRLA